jgi:hypothetical protein
VIDLQLERVPCPPQYLEGRQMDVENAVFAAVIGFLIGGIAFAFLYYFMV